MCFSEPPWPLFPTSGELWVCRERGMTFLSTSSAMLPSGLGTERPDVPQGRSILGLILSAPACSWLSSLAELVSFPHDSSSEIWLWFSFVSRPRSLFCSLNEGRDTSSPGRGAPLAKLAAYTKWDNKTFPACLNKSTLRKAVSRSTDTKSWNDSFPHPVDQWFECICNWCESKLQNVITANAWKAMYNLPPCLTA